MFHVITGGSGSGKSAYAEECIVKYLKEVKNERRSLYYIATMEPFGEETLQKIERHHKMREGKGFRNIECYTDLAEKVQCLQGEYSSVLLECMSNLAANEFYKRVLQNQEDESAYTSITGLEDETIDVLKKGITSLYESCENVVIVTNEVCSEYVHISEEMKSYKKILSEVNRWMAVQADEVTEVVYGIPVKVRG